MALSFRCIVFSWLIWIGRCKRKTIFLLLLKQPMIRYFVYSEAFKVICGFPSYWHFQLGLCSIFSNRRFYSIFSIRCFFSRIERPYKRLDAVIGTRILPLLSPPRLLNQTLEQMNSKFELCTIHFLLDDSGNAENQMVEIQMQLRLGGCVICVENCITQPLPLAKLDLLY